MYSNSRRAVRNSGQQGEWFQIDTGVWQGRILSPIMLFLLVMDWILRRAADDSDCGIAWIDKKRLTDLDFPDDIALLDSTWKGMAELTKTSKIRQEWLDCA